MNMHRYELQTLKYLALYKLFAIALMLVSIVFLLFGLYVTVFRDQTSGERLLNNASTAASIVVLCCGYLMLHFLNIIGKFKRHNQGHMSTGKNPNQ